jgi:hypothetical protein
LTNKRLSYFSQQSQIRAAIQQYDLKRPVGELTPSSWGFRAAASGWGFFSSFAPGFGEAQDLRILDDPGASKWEKALAGLSLGVSAFTLGLTPNAGTLLRGGDAAGGVTRIDGLERLTPSQISRLSGLASNGENTIDDVVAVLIQRAQCFTRDTLVSTDSGRRPIGEIQVGDHVHSFNFKSGEWDLCRVERRIDSLYSGGLIRVELADSVIETTDSHPFWVVEGENLQQRSVPSHVEKGEDEGEAIEGRWVASHELLPGDKVVCQDGIQREVTAVSRELKADLAVCGVELDSSRFAQLRRGRAWHPCSQRG